MAKKIKVWVNNTQLRRGEHGYDQGQIIANVYGPYHEDGDEDWSTPAVVVVADERVFTESEVRAIVDEISNYVEGYFFDRAEIAGLVSKHGITLEPA